ncbi:ABC transporter permease/substrate-binding protein [Enorma phocaeensis]|uniref:ABC transporter permease/substrate-binding protein n=1 Tax=Enorma phocaeensis TaxID=1871019 RepID=UPI003D15F7CB
MAHAELRGDDHLVAHRAQGLPHRVLVVELAALSVFTHVALGRVEEGVTHHDWIDRIFDANPSMNDVYPKDARYVLEAFVLDNGELELFDLGTSPIYRRAFTLTVYALLPMVRNTHTGLSNIDPAILEAARGMGSTRWQTLVRVKLPLALPVIMSGIRSMATMTIALAGIASFIGAGGLGVAIYRGITTNNAAMTIAGSLLIAALALIVDLVLGVIDRRMQMRSTQARRHNRIAAVAALAARAVVAALALAPAPSAGTIRVATKPMTEQYVMGEALDILIEQDTDLDVELTQGVGGGIANIMPAMEAGEFDLYPEYTGTTWNEGLGETGVYTEDQFATLAQRYQDDFDMSWVGMYGFNNTYGLVVRREVAERYDLKTYSDLAAVAPELTFGAEYDFFEREDGYDALCETYGLSFGSTMDLDIGLKYQALDQDQIDVMVIFTTDGQLSTADAAVLEDDQGFFPSYLCGNIVRNEAHE